MVRRLHSDDGQFVISAQKVEVGKTEAKSQDIFYSLLSELAWALWGSIVLAEGHMTR